MEVRIQLYDEIKGIDISEFFHDLVEAQDWLAYHSELLYEDLPDDVYVPSRIQDKYTVTRISLSNIEPIGYTRRLKDLLANGYSITYEGKTGITLEKDKDV